MVRVVVDIGSEWHWIMAVKDNEVIVRVIVVVVASDSGCRVLLLLCAATGNEKVWLLLGTVGLNGFLLALCEL